MKIEVTDIDNDMLTVGWRCGDISGFFGNIEKDRTIISLVNQISRLVAESLEMEHDDE